ncbi:unnamed protein product [Euphydryas editha]|uniref:Uncharacterized protein n=1 Tax=Euphydryas editha TaxID=104508 RepID=A0AAU9UU34_EUPED|nr:unnamed protein product [Euphydryas editha]
MLQQNLEDNKLSPWKVQHIFEDFQVFNNISSMENQLSKKHTDLFFNITDCAWESYDSVMSLTSQNLKEVGLFGRKSTSVYMTLSHNFPRRRTSGTQATASINKSFQVCDEWKKQSKRQIDTNSDYCSTCSVSTFAFHEYSCRVSENLLNPEIYFFGKKKEKSEAKGMGSKSSHTKLQKTSQTTNTGGKSDLKKSSSKSSIQSGSTTKVKKPTSTATSKPKPNLPTKKSKGAATASGTSKTVTIKDEKSQKPCPALGTTKGDMMVTVSHIKIGPKEICPIHGNDPCQGPKCVLASSGEEQGSVKVTTVNNPRKGVFEVVIRRLTGAPLAKNELMLEWTPPPSRPSQCSAPCPLPYIPSRPCRHSKCKLIVCRPSLCRPKCSRKKPCGQACSRSPPCKRCCKTMCCDNPCHSCKPCPTKTCCSPSKCIKCVQPCKTPCAVPCKSSPCLKPCPVGRKRPRKSRSQPRIKSYRKKHSPCYNRSKACPVVRCRSIPGPCIMHCGIRPPCLPRNCISVLPCKLKKASMESCLKTCSSCCG